MRPLLQKIKPSSGVAPLLHALLRVILPLGVFVLATLDISIWLPLLLVLLSKWRIFAVRARFWPANIRANAVDIMVGVSAVLYMVHTDSSSLRFGWAILYALWQIFIKPRSGIFWISIQSGLGQLVGLIALFVAWSGGPLLGLVVVSGLICYLAARHFFDAYTEPYAKMLAYLWGYFGAALLWVLGHLLLMYPRRDGVMAQPTIFLTIISFTLGAIYYLEHFDKLSRTIRRELLYICGGAVVVLVVSLYYEGLHLIV